ncbi:hypothetical protein KCU98_g257, partial [Aureobasidium melanogenum]
MCSLLCVSCGSKKHFRICQTNLFEPQPTNPALNAAYSVSDQSTNLKSTKIALHPSERVHLFYISFLSFSPLTRLSKATYRTSQTDPLVYAFDVYVFLSVWLHFMAIDCYLVWRCCCGGGGCSVGKDGIRFLEYSAFGKDCVSSCLLLPSPFLCKNVKDRNSSFCELLQEATKKKQAQHSTIQLSAAECLVLAWTGPLCWIRQGSTLTVQVGVFSDLLMASILFLLASAFFRALIVHKMDGSSQGLARRRSETRRKKRKKKPQLKMERAMRKVTSHDR